MAVLDLGSDIEAAGGKRLGTLFWVAFGWITFAFALALFANFLPLHSPTLATRSSTGAWSWNGTAWSRCARTATAASRVSSQHRAHLP